MLGRKKSKTSVIALGKPIGVVTYGSKREFNKKYEELLAKEFRKRHSIRLVKVV